MLIGGILTKATLRLLYDAINAADFSDGDDCPISSLKDLKECIISGRPLSLLNTDSSYDEPADLKQFCMENHLAYQLHWDASYEYDKETQWWRPGMIREQDKLLTHSGYDFVIADKVREIFAQHDEKSLDAKKALEKIRKLLPPKDPDILPLCVANPETLGGKIIEADLLFQEVLDDNCALASSG
jgi:hypothetical protein